MNTVEKILALLDENGNEQKDLAHFLGVNAQTISDWKSGKTKSYKRHIDKIAEYFNVSVDYLLQNDYPAPKKQFPVTKTKSSDLIEDFMKVFDELSSEDKIKLMYKAVELKNKE